MNISGTHIGRDSSACLVRDGRIVADVAEGKLTRIGQRVKVGGNVRIYRP